MEQISLTKDELKDLVKAGAYEALESIKLVNRKEALKLLNCTAYRFNRLVQSKVLQPMPNGMYSMHDIIHLRKVANLKKLCD